MDGAEIYGVDFSGARDAGERIWIAEAVIEAKALIVQNCFRAESLPGGGKEPEKCLPALRKFMTDRPGALFGLDFPFGMPRELVQERSWEDFIHAFPKRYRAPGHFRDTCLRRSSNRELKRLTDIQNQAPFSPYNLRIYRQTYYGIREILYPLVRDNLASIIPMQSEEEGQPRVMEICPAATLKREGLYGRYKGISGGRRQRSCQVENTIDPGVKAAPQDQGKEGQSPYPGRPKW
ncbi:MAG: hypothetical protein JRH06_14420 [Deltaproteobacteria bacterium]|nr:hypothetical protein [Deltaproteobacteria bacterium]MBW2138732.1 hypothetical protein [Deltaproteobacteria bacterium]